MTEIAKLNDSFVNDIRKIINDGRKLAYHAINAAMIETYWQIGRRIVEEEQQGNAYAEYGTMLIDMLSKQMTLDFGNGFSPRYLRSFRQFYLVVPNYEIWKSRFPNLTWTHIYRTLRVGDETAVRG